MLGLRARNQHGRRNNKIHSPEFLMAGDVLRWVRRVSVQRAHGRSERSCIVDGEFALGVRVKIGPVATQSEHQEQFGVQARGWELHPQ
jgi:hypothetical protein